MPLTEPLPQWCKSNTKKDTRGKSLGETANDPVSQSGKQATRQPSSQPASLSFPKLRASSAQGAAQGLQVFQHNPLGIDPFLYGLRALERSFFVAKLPAVTPCMHYKVHFGNDATPICFYNNAITRDYHSNTLYLTEGYYSIVYECGVSNHIIHV